MGKVPIRRSGFGQLASASKLEPLCVCAEPINRVDPSDMKMECVTNNDGSEECTVIPDPPPE